MIWAQQGRYDKAKTELEPALAAHPDYAIAHENLGDVYTRLAGSEYDRARAGQDEQERASQLTLIRELSRCSSSTAPKPSVPKPATPKPASPVKPKK